jgi:hypothetical protein
MDDPMAGVRRGVGAGNDERNPKSAAARFVASHLAPAERRVARHRVNAVVL